MMINRIMLMFSKTIHGNKASIFCRLKLYWFYSLKQVISLTFHTFRRQQLIFCRYQTTKIWSEMKNILVKMCVSTEHSNLMKLLLSSHLEMCQPFWNFIISNFIFQSHFDLIMKYIVKCDRKILIILLDFISFSDSWFIRELILPMLIISEEVISKRKSIPYLSIKR